MLATNLNYDFYDFFEVVNRISSVVSSNKIHPFWYLMVPVLETEFVCGSLFIKKPSLNAKVVVASLVSFLSGISIFNIDEFEN